MISMNVAVDTWAERVLAIVGIAGLAYGIYRFIAERRQKADPESDQGENFPIVRYCLPSFPSTPIL